MSMSKKQKLLKKTETDKYRQFYKTRTETDREILTDFFKRLDLHITLCRKFKHAIFDDFEKGFMYYDSIGISVEKAAPLWLPKNGGLLRQTPRLVVPAGLRRKNFPCQ